MIRYWSYPRGIACDVVGYKVHLEAMSTVTNSAQRNAFEMGLYATKETRPLTDLPMFTAPSMSPCHPETVLIDADEEQEEEEEYLRDFAELQGAPSVHGEAKAETKASGADPNNGEGKAEKEEVPSAKTFFCAYLECIPP